VAGLLATGVLAVGLGTGVVAARAGAAPAPAPAPVTSAAGGVQAAAVQIPTGSWVELWTPFITPTMHKCMDIAPSGVLLMKIFHCHGGDNQLWQFIDLGGGSYWIVSKYWGTCLSTMPTNDGVSVRSCDATSGTHWHVVPSAYDPSGFQLVNDEWGGCIGSDVAVPTGDNSKELRLWGCTNSPVFNADVQVQTWRIG
jgi:hypothetical protein